MIKREHFKREQTISSDGLVSYSSLPLKGGFCNSADSVLSSMCVILIPPPYNTVNNNEEEVTI